MGRYLFANKIWVLAALLIICGVTIVTCYQSERSALSETEDAYRPQMGVDHFVRWSKEIADTLMKPYFYPDLDKSVLFAQGHSITATQFANRMILRKAMLRHGFKPLDSEWWHFTLKEEPFPDTYFTFPVKQLNR